MKWAFLNFLFLAVCLGNKLFEGLAKPIPGTKFVVSKSEGGKSFKMKEGDIPINFKESDIQDGGFFMNCMFGKANYNALQSDTAYYISLFYSLGIGFSHIFVQQEFAIFM